MSCFFVPGYVWLRILWDLGEVTLKHAEATEVTIQPLVERTSAQLIVEDNKTDFSMEQAEKSKGVPKKHQAKAIQHLLLIFR